MTFDDIKKQSFPLLCTSLASLGYALLFSLLMLEKQNSVYILFIAAVAVLFVYRFARIQRSLRLCVLSGVFSVLLSSALLFVRQIDLENKQFLKVSRGLPVRILLLAAGLFLVIAVLLDRLSQIELSRYLEANGSGRFSARKAGLLAGGAAFLCWMLFLLRFYPGATSIDSYYVILQAAGEMAPSDAHPYTYTLIATLCVRIGMLFGDLSFGVAVFAFAHVLFQSICVAYLVSFLYQRGLHAFLIGGVVVYFIVSPIFGSLSITLWKDMPFSACVVIYTIQLLKVLESGGKRLKSPKTGTSFALISAFTSLMRHNGYYVVAVVTVILLVMYLIRLKKQVLLLLPVLLFSLIAGPAVQRIYYAAGVKPGASTEAISIPAQQMIYTLEQGGEVSPEQKETLERFFPPEKRQAYDPFLSDPIKNSMDRAYFNANTGAFFKLWLEMLPKNVKLYIKSYAMITSGYWGPGIKSIIIDPNANYMAESGIEKRNLLPLKSSLFDLPFRNVRNFDFLSIGSMVWIMLLCGTLLLYKRQYLRLMSLLPILGVWGTLMVATPVACSFRYIYALPLLLPYLIFIALEKPIEQKRMNTPAKEVNAH